MDSRIANARALGFASFATGTWMYCMVTAGWFPDTLLTTPSMGLISVAVMLSLFIAALASFLRTDHWAAFFFMFWAAIWWGVHATGGAAGPDPRYAGWFFAAITVVSAILFLAALRDKESLPVRLVSLGLGLEFVCWALGAWGLGDFFVVLAGYIGLVTALCAFWASAMEALGGEVGKGGAKGAAPSPGPSAV